jgi:mannose-6-phosphate isomerase-like protein (cupin superfamily)/ribosomal protein S18 acetylase RimI-like enzyme
MGLGRQVGESITLRHATRADAARLAAFAERIFVETFGHGVPPDDMAAHLAKSFGPEQQAREIDDPTVVTLVGERDGEIRAYAQLRESEPPACVPAGPSLQLWRIYVDTPLHGTGVAQQVMRVVTSVAAARGASLLWLTMWEQNHRARAFYERSGFCDAGTHPFVLGSRVETDRVFVIRVRREESPRAEAPGLPRIVAPGLQPRADHDAMRFPPSDRTTSEHYTWGDACDGWRLLSGPDLAVIEERVPPGRGEVRHVHARARQFFYVISGTATLEIDGEVVTFTAGQGVHVPPGLPHRFSNESSDDVVFLVVSSPATTGDRTENP